jgi:putative acetyltransferase
VIIRPERPEDAAELARLIDAAFGDTETSLFTQELRESDGYVPELTFVADDDGELVGFTMLSYVAVEERPVLILTPMAVRPDRQRAGIGGAVVRAALAAAEQRGEPLVLVEGVPSYYPQFGFRPALELGLERPDDRIPEDAWMVAPLRAYDPALRGRVAYPPFFPPPPNVD